MAWRGLVLALLATPLLVAGSTVPAFAGTPGLPQAVCDRLLMSPPDGAGLQQCPSVVPYVVHRLDGVAQPILVIGAFATGDALTFPADPGVTVTSSTVLAPALMLATIIVRATPDTSTTPQIPAASLGGAVIATNGDPCTYCGPDIVDGLDLATGLSAAAMQILKGEVTSIVCGVPLPQRTTVQNAVDMSLGLVWGPLDRSC